LLISDLVFGPAEVKRPFNPKLEIYNPKSQRLTIKRGPRRSGVENLEGTSSTTHFGSQTSFLILDFRFPVLDRG
jgi:hypothetical protein